MKFKLGIFIVAAVLMLTFQAQAASLVPGFDDGTYIGTGRLSGTNHRWLEVPETLKVVVRGNTLVATGIAKYWGFQLWPATTLTMRALPISPNDPDDFRYRIIDLASGQNIGTMSCIPFGNCDVKLSLAGGALTFDEVVNLDSGSVSVYGRQNYQATSYTPYPFKGHWVRTSFAATLFRTN